MGNSYFQFKEFRIEQDRCAMKVCTDSCLFGAWIPVSPDCKTILDIGTGTGLLALILAQRTQASIDAVEIEPRAFEQATDNVQNSPWPDRIRVIHSDIAAFVAGKKYDLIVCNPPFYENSWRSECDLEAIAKHSSELTLDFLFKNLDRLAHPETEVTLLLPFFRKDEADELAKSMDWRIRQQLLVNNRPGEPFFRYLANYTKNRNVTPPIKQTLTIYRERTEYTNEFTELLSSLYI